MADLFRGLDGINNARSNPDGSVNLSMNGKKVTTACLEIPTEPILGVGPLAAFTFATNQLHVRERIGSCPGMIINSIELFKQNMYSGTSLAELEEAAKSSNSKMLQLGDCLMLGLNGWPRDPPRACILYSAAAWGCTEEEEPTIQGIPVGDPKAMLAAASICIGYRGTLLGYSGGERCPFHE